MAVADALDNLPVPARTRREKMLEALALYDEGVAMQRIHFRRRYPELSAEEIERKLESWLLREDES